ncbi:MAG: hypothetical protein JW760_02855 [Spirochaetales bacterium]|nr:hypothetical protein [Spirochaetales bacterium]
MDPEIAELMGLEGSGEDGTPDFGDLFEEGGQKAEEKEPEDLSKATFPVITRFSTEKEQAFLKNPDYYKLALSGEGEAAQRLHSLMSSFLKAEDPKDKSMYRGKIVSAYWNLLESIVPKIASHLPEPKKMMLRFGLLLPSILSPEQRSLISKIILENETGEPVYYTDEWFDKIARGLVNPSAQDEVKASKSNDSQRILGLIEKARGQRDFQINVIRNKMLELSGCEEELFSGARELANHAVRKEYDIKEGYTPAQREIIKNLNSLLRQISNYDREISGMYRDLERAEENLAGLKEKAEDLGGESLVDSKTILSEFNTFRQMAKMCVGRQGNHMPVLMKQYFRPNLRDIGTRENIIQIMAEIERLDSVVFCRTFKRETSRIVPHIILIPCYGDRGICWEPFERFNRATSRGRIAIPMFPKDLKEAVITALGDLRWQVAKEKAQHYWMEEGLTGHYYQWFSERKLKGDVKERFVQDYILWIMKESEGTQKLEREVRAIFWRFMPFPDDLRERLKNRGFVYAELFKKDINRSMSDGY